MRSNSERKGKTKQSYVAVPKNIPNHEHGFKSVKTTELPVSIGDFCLQSLSLLSGCSTARAGSKGSHGTDWGKDLPQQPCPCVRSGAELVMEHTKNLPYINACKSLAQDSSKPLWEPTEMTICYQRAEMHLEGKNEAGKKTVSVTLRALLPALSLS